jgi:hypothetical protein
MLSVEVASRGTIWAPLAFSKLKMRVLWSLEMRVLSGSFLFQPGVLPMQGEGDKAARRLAGSREKERSRSALIEVSGGRTNFSILRFISVSPHG